MSDVSIILAQIEAGDAKATERLLPLVYEELRKLAATKLTHERPGQTLDATGLVHEAYLRLVGDGAPQTWDSRRHFFAAAAEAMRRILIDRARQKSSLKRGGNLARHSLTDVDLADAAQLGAAYDGMDLLELNEALDRFERLDPAKAQLVKLRYFTGLTIPQVAAVLGISTTTADRNWAYARAWLHAELRK